METMDAATRALVLEWVLARRRAGAAVLLATHDTAPLTGSVDRVLEVSAGRITSKG
jgi:ABC-type ATPase involved in cell division